MSLRSSIALLVFVCDSVEVHVSPPPPGVHDYEEYWCSTNGARSLEVSLGEKNKTVAVVPAVQVRLSDFRNGDALWTTDALWGGSPLAHPISQAARKANCAAEGGSGCVSAIFNSCKYVSLMM